MRTLCSVVIVVALSHVVRADAPTAQQLFEEGRALLDAGQAGPACEKFEAALKLEPEGLGTILNLGLCNEQRDRIATALAWFRRAHVRASESGKTDTEQAAKDKTSALVQRVPLIKLVGHPAAGTVVTVDGVKVSDLDYGHYEVDAGKHVVAITAPKLAGATKEITSVDGQAETISIELAPPPPPVPPKQFELVDRGAAERHEAYIFGGVGVAAMAGIGVLGLVARSHYNATDMLDSRDTWRNVVRYTGSAMFLAGGAAVVWGVVLYRRAPQPERVEITPSVGRDGVGVTAGGTF